MILVYLEVSLGPKQSPWGAACVGFGATGHRLEVMRLGFRTMPKIQGFFGGGAGGFKKLLDVQRHRRRHDFRLRLALALGIHGTSIGTSAGDKIFQWKDWRASFSAW